MGVLKVIEVLSNSNKSWEDATQKPSNTLQRQLKTSDLRMFRTRV